MAAGGHRRAALAQSPAACANVFAMSVWSELRRRNVFKVGAAYAVVAWLLIQIVASVQEPLGLPDWFDTAVIVLLILGFPVAVLLAWAYELTPDGIRREPDSVQPASSPARAPPWVAYAVVGGALLLAIALFVVREGVGPTAQASVQTLLSRPSVLVLPFTNVSGEASQDYLALGLTDELIGGLQQTRSFPVAARNASYEYDDTKQGAQEFARSMGASYLLEGNISVTGDGVRVRAALSGVDGSQVWSESFQGNTGTTQIFDISDEIVSQVATAVLESEVQRVHREDRPPADAWEHYIKGLTTVLDFDPDSYADARDHLNAAIGIAPEMAEAWWARGELEALDYASKSLSAAGDLDELDSMIDFFRRSHELSPFYGAACGCLGMLLTAVGKDAEARAVFDQAIDANPLSADLRVDYATFLLWEGRYEEAAKDLDIAMKLGLTRADQSLLWATRSIIALAEGDEAAAADAVNRAIFVGGRDPFSMPMAAALLYVLGEQKEAEDFYEDMLDLYPGISAQNPLLRVQLQPIDDILAEQRERGEWDGPASTVEIFDMLAHQG